MTDRAAMQAAPGSGAGQPMRWRRRVLYWLLVFVAVFVVCFWFAEPLFRFLMQPVADAMADYGHSGVAQRMAFTALTEVFFTYVKVAVFAAAFICFPLFLADLWRAKVRQAGGRGKSAGARGAVSMIVAFFLGGALIYAVVFPALTRLWFALQAKPSPDALPIQLEPMVSEFLSQLMHWMFAAGLVFLLPVALFLWIRARRSGSGGSPGQTVDVFT